MHLHSSPERIVTILQPTGHLDTYSILLLRMQLERATAVQSAYLVIDLSQATFLDSRALATLVYHMKRCRAGGGDLYLCGLAQPIRMILELTRLHKAIEIFPNQPSAIAAYATRLNHNREDASALNVREPVTAGSG